MQIATVMSRWPGDSADVVFLPLGRAFHLKDRTQTLKEPFLRGVPASVEAARQTQPQATNTASYVLDSNPHCVEFSLMRTIEFTPEAPPRRGPTHLRNGRKKRAQAEPPKCGPSLAIQRSLLLRKPTNTHFTLGRKGTASVLASPSRAPNLKSYGCHTALPQLGVLKRGMRLLDFQGLGLILFCCELLKGS